MSKHLKIGQEEWRSVDSLCSSNYQTIELGGLDNMTNDEVAETRLENVCKKENCHIFGIQTMDIPTTRFLILHLLC